MSSGIWTRYISETDEHQEEFNTERPQRTIQNLTSDERDSQTPEKPQEQHSASKALFTPPHFGKLEVYIISQASKENPISLYGSKHKPTSVNKGTCSLFHFGPQNSAQRENKT